MLAGGPYDAEDPELMAERRQCQELLAEWNSVVHEDERAALLPSLLGSVGEDVVVQRPLMCDYGYNIALGDRTFINYGAMILDVCPVTIGADVQIATSVQLLTAHHPVDPGERKAGIELGAPINIGDNVWIGGGVIVCPGVTIGADSVIGAGSVVTRDIPERVVAVGNPCRVVRSI